MKDFASDFKTDPERHTIFVCGAGYDIIALKPSGVLIAETVSE
jgi:hypothetical protein